MNHQQPRWRLWMLHDPTTCCKTAPAGAVIYVGVRKDGTSKPSDLTYLESIPRSETAVRERLSDLQARGVRPTVRVIDEGRWARALPSREHAEFAMDALIASLTPKPLNRADGGMRTLPGDVVEAGQAADPVPLMPEGMIVQVEAATGYGDDIFTAGMEVTVQGHRRFYGVMPRTIMQHLADGPMPLLLVTRASTATGSLPAGLVIATGIATGVVTLDESRRLREVQYAPAEQATDLAHAVRRQYLHKLVLLDDPAALRLGG